MQTKRNPKLIFTKNSLLINHETLPIGWYQFLNDSDFQQKLCEKLNLNKPINCYIHPSLLKSQTLFFGKISYVHYEAKAQVKQKLHQLFPKVVISPHPRSLKSKVFSYLPAIPGLILFCLVLLSLLSYVGVTLYNNNLALRNQALNLSLQNKAKIHKIKLSHHAKKVRTNNTQLFLKIRQLDELSLPLINIIVSAKVVKLMGVTTSNQWDGLDKKVRALIDAKNGESKIISRKDNFIRWEGHYDI